MGAHTALSLEEYLRTSFPDLDREYRDGEIVERTLPDYYHAKVQGRLGMIFGALQAGRPLFPCAETRMRLNANTVVIPDFAVFHGSEPERLPETPPLVAIEILSPDDRFSMVCAKLEKYRDWGIRNVWLIDPDSRRLYTFDEGLSETARFEIPEFDIRITPAEIFG